MHQSSILSVTLVVFFVSSTHSQQPPHFGNEHHGILVAVSPSGVQYVDIGVSQTIESFDKNSPGDEYFKAIDLKDGGHRLIPVDDDLVVLRKLIVSANHVIRVTKNNVDLIDFKGVSLAKLGTYSDWIKPSAKIGDRLDDQSTKKVADEIEEYYERHPQPAGSRPVRSGATHFADSLCRRERHNDELVPLLNSRVLINNRPLSMQEILVVVSKDKDGITLEFGQDMVQGPYWGNSETIPKKVRDLRANNKEDFIPANVLKMIPLADGKNGIYLMGSYFDRNVRLRVSPSRVYLTKQSASISSDKLNIEFGPEVLVKEAPFPQFSESVLNEVDVGTTIRDRYTIKRLHEFLFDAGEFSRLK
jgi:hypothetical protein